MWSDGGKLLKVFEGLKFKRASTPIHRLDPRAKFLVSCVVFALALIFTELYVLLIIFLVQLPMIFSAHIQHEWSRSVRGSLSLTLIIFFTNLIVGYFAGTFRSMNDLLVYSVTLAFRFVVLMSSFSIFFLTTSPDDLSLALEQSHIPYEFCFAFTTAVRFVPVLANEAQTIMDAQKSKGLELEKGNFFKRIRNYIPILIPLIVGAIRRSLELAEAMESRAFGANKKRTNLYVLRFKKSDTAASIISLVILIVAIYIRLYVPLPTIQHLLA
ncbi:MAG: energy-coupling factor transporter transmembrane component T [Candidatus Bathyarchaeota archaeon]